MSEIVKQAAFSREGVLVRGQKSCVGMHEAV